MPLEPALRRRAQGEFANQLARQLRLGALSQPPRAGTLRPLHVRNGRELIAVALALSSTLSLQRHALQGTPPRRPDASVAAPPIAGNGAALGVALLPAAQASQDADQPLLPMHGPPGSRVAIPLENVANGVLASCAARPRTCPRALAAGAFAAATVLTSAAAGAALGFTWGRATVPDCPLPDDPATPGMSLPDTLFHLLPAAAQHRLLDIMHNCGGDHACATTAIRSLLQELPPALQQRIEETVAVEPPGAASLAWPPPAAAIAPPSPLSWLEAATALLEGVYDPVGAAYLLDLEKIAQATLEAQAGQPRGTRERVANQRRSAAIEALFNDTGHALERLDFSINARDLRGVPGTTRGRNLLLTFAGAGTPAHTLMLVAHGDMTGTDSGSSGALDNGTGVATLLALTRELHDTTLPRGTRVQLLVSDHGERGMMGAKAHVQRCLAQRQCPDAVLNLDGLGRGEGLAVCGSEQRHRFVMDAVRTDQRHPGTVNAHERHLRQLLQQSASDLGVRQHPYTAWTHVSDHLPFQREGIAALGLSRMSAAELDADAQLQAAHADLLGRHAAVDWARMDDYLAGRLSRADTEDMRDTLAEHNAVSRRYRRLQDSASRSTVHSGLDQLDQAQRRAALQTLEVVRRTVHAWLAHPEPDLRAVS